MSRRAQDMRKHNALQMAGADQQRRRERSKLTKKLATMDMTPEAAYFFEHGYLAKEDRVTTFARYLETALKPTTSVKAIPVLLDLGMKWGIIPTAKELNFKRRRVRTR